MFSLAWSLPVRPTFSNLNFLRQVKKSGTKTLAEVTVLGGV